MANVAHTYKSQPLTIFIIFQLQIVADGKKDPCNRVMWWICVKSVWFNLHIYCQPSVRIYLKLSYWKSLKN